jgi:aspartyl-tRNA(Asn)/glutamyl-tRNA(Gln) amidotransferase subunit C
MALSQQDIVKIANLSKLEMTALEGEEMLTRLNGFFEIVEQMRAVDTKGIEPMAHPTHAMSEAMQAQKKLQMIQLRLRDDVASEPNNREANQLSAPAVERGLFLVPKVIE